MILFDHEVTLEQIQAGIDISDEFHGTHKLSIEVEALLLQMAYATVTRIVLNEETLNSLPEDVRAQNSEEEHMVLFLYSMLVAAHQLGSGGTPVDEDGAIGEFIETLEID